MHIYLVRHGETIWNVEGRTQGNLDIPLSNHGIKQSELLAERIKREGISHIYTSDLTRASQTSLIIGQKIGIQPEKIKELREINLGVWQGCNKKEIEKDYPGQLKRYRFDTSFAPLGGETLDSLNDRVRRFIRALDLIKGNIEKKILIVSHAYPIRMLISELLMIPLRYLWDMQLDNTGVSVVYWKHNEISRLVCLNDICHLLSE
ncbi:MAG: histidine phosphatase family protein [Clostridiales bacterium]|nr:histidine phosphatase family protein [Clostridiales bacterium]